MCILLDVQRCSKSLVMLGVVGWAKKKKFKFQS